LALIILYNVASYQLNTSGADAAELERESSRRPLAPLMTGCWRPSFNEILVLEGPQQVDWKLCIPAGARKGQPAGHRRERLQLPACSRRLQVFGGADEPGDARKHDRRRPN